MNEEPRITAPVVFCGIVEKVEPGEALDDLFVLNHVHFRVEAACRPEGQADFPRTTMLRSPASRVLDPEPIEGGTFTYRTFRLGEEAVVFATSWNGDLKACFVQPTVVEEARGAIGMLAGVNPGSLQYLKASEADRVAQLALYSRIIEAFQARGAG